MPNQGMEGSFVRNSWDDGDDIAELKFVEGSGLSGSVETDHDNLHLLGEEPFENLPEHKPHLALLLIWPTASHSQKVRQIQLID